MQGTAGGVWSEAGGLGGGRGSSVMQGTAGGGGGGGSGVRQGI